MPVHRVPCIPMIEVPYIAADTEHDRDIPMARELIGILHGAYPGHEWFVLIRGGVVQIKKLEWSSNWGMALMYANLKGDATARKRDVLRAAGEFLSVGILLVGAILVNSVTQSRVFLRNTCEGSPCDRSNNR